MKEEEKDKKPSVVVNYKVVILVGICFIVAMVSLALFLQEKKPKQDNCVNDTFDKFGLKDDEKDAIDLAYLSYLDYLRQKKESAGILYQQQWQNVSNRTRDAYVYLLKCKGININ